MQVKAYKNFAMSDTAFKPNTKNALLSDIPATLRNNTYENAILELNNEIADFVQYYHANTDSTVLNPFFGDLNFQEWVHLLHKHVVHHCKQFGLI